MGECHHQKKKENNSEKEKRNTIKGAVITVSDRCSRGLRTDESGPLVREILKQYGVDTDDNYYIIPDGIAPLRQLLQELIRKEIRVVVTSGGTGISDRDFTPEATKEFIKLPLENLSSLIACKGYAHTPFAVMSRAMIGLTDRGEKACLIVNTPGSLHGVKDSLDIVGPLIHHILAQCDPHHYGKNDNHPH